MIKKVVKWAGLLLILTSITFLNACAKEIKVNSLEKKNIALIVKMNSGYHWGTVKQGADTAAREFNVNIDYNATAEEEDVSGQVKLANQALEKNVDALILAASDSKALAQVAEKAYIRHIPVILIDSQVDTDKVKSFIATDNIIAGQNSGKTLVDIAGEDSQVALISSVKDERNSEMREKGLMDIISKYPGIKIMNREYCSSDVKLAAQLTKKIIADKAGINAIVAFNEAASEGAAETVEQMHLTGKVKVIGFDNTPKVIDYMDKGVIQATITQNLFSMGYLGVKYAVDAINQKSIPKYVDTGSKIISRDTMYLPENQKLLFPFVK